MDKEFTKTWRYRIGLGLFILGNFFLITAMLLPLAGIFPASLLTILVVSGEVISMASIIFLGKAGFQALKRKLSGTVKRQLYKPVGAFRHYLGIVLYCVNALFLYAIVVFALAAVDSVTTETPFMWGMDLQQQTKLIWGTFVMAELSFVVSLFLLGPDWWSKVRKLFVWDKETFNLER